jgi:hypothetical protein
MTKVQVKAKIRFTILYAHERVALAADCQKITQIEEPIVTVHIPDNLIGLLTSLRQYETVGLWLDFPPQNIFIETTRKE